MVRRGLSSRSHDDRRDRRHDAGEAQRPSSTSTSAPGRPQGRSRTSICRRCPQNVPSQIDVPATGRVQSSVQLVETLPICCATDPAWPLLQLANTRPDRRILLVVALPRFARSARLRVRRRRARSGGAHAVDFGIEYGCDPQNIVPAQAQIATILAQLQSTPIEPDRLLRAKALLMGEVPIREASYDGVPPSCCNYAYARAPARSERHRRAERSSTRQESVRGGNRASTCVPTASCASSPDRRRPSGGGRAASNARTMEPVEGIGFDLDHTLAIDNRLERVAFLRLLEMRAG